MPWNHPQTISIPNPQSVKNLSPRKVVLGAKKVRTAALRSQELIVQYMQKRIQPPYSTQRQKGENMS